MLLLDERILADGAHARTFASLVGDRVRIHDAATRTLEAKTDIAPPPGDASSPAAIRHAVATHVDGVADGMLSIAALDKVMTRYGRELDAGVRLDGDALDLPGGYRLRRLRYHAIVDAEGRDYLVWERSGADPLAVVATMVTAALRYLVLRLTHDGGAASTLGGNNGSQESET
ncbi:MAG: hypothetical protein ACKV2T_06445 [Kofleriaceae bacterium]